jgi:dUTP pyrophosphatase
MPEIQVLRESVGAKLPTQATDRAQCIDFYAAEDAQLLINETKGISLGIRVILPEGYGLEFRERSGLALKGIEIGGGIIDEDYHGVLRAIVRNSGEAVFKISAGDKIVQAELVRRIPIKIIDVGPLTFQHAAESVNSERGDRGFGSTG